MAVTDLRIPGPTPVPPAVMEAMQGEMIPHRGPVFQALYRDLLAQLKRIHGTSGDILIFPGSGSSGWEASIVNTLSPGDTVLSFVTGDFGDRFVKVARAFGMNVVRTDLEWGQAATADVVRPVLDAHPEAKAVLYTYSETSTAVANPVEDIGPMVRDHGALLLVDGVSAVAGLPVEMDAWGIDIIFSGSQKAFMCPPGVVILGVGSRVWPFYERSTLPRYFWDFGPAKRWADEGYTVTTPPLTLLYGLKAACDMIEAEGLPALYARHARLARLVRQGMQELGYRLVADPEYPSTTVTAAYPPEGIAAPDVIRRMREDHGIEIAGGQAHIRDKIIRIGHMGWTYEPELEHTLEALGAVTRALAGE